MGRSTSKREKLELLTTNFSYRMLVGETVLRFFMVKDLLLEDEPFREKDEPFPLGDVVARVNITEAIIDQKDRVIIRGSVEGKAVFYSRQGPKEVAWSEEAVQKEVDLPGALPGMEVHAHGRVCSLGEEESPMETEGKILYQLKIEVEVLLAIVDPQQLDLTVGVKDIPAEKVSRAVIAAEELLEEQAVPFKLTKAYQFNAEIDFIKALNYYLKDFSWSLEKDGINFKGEIVTVLFFLTGGESGFKENRQQFSRQISFPNLKKGVAVNLFPRVESVAYNVTGNSAQETVHVDLLIRATRTVQQEIISDIQGAAVKKEYLLLPKVIGVAKEPLEFVQKLDFPYPREITAGPCRLLNYHVNVLDERVEITGTLEKIIYYIPAIGDDLKVEDSDTELLPLIVKVEEDFQSSLYLPGVNPSVETAVYFNIGTAEFAPTENATLQVSHALIEIKAWEVQEFTVVVPYRVPPGTSMVIYSAKRGDTLLKIARSYGVKAPLIAEANGLEEDASLEAGQKLLIPLMFAADY